ncbi:hypothetical protein, conserved [Eimeria tenella]|uniref:Transmembrane protein n=1 Tax=Eimeria tenella TaxID=5802 RepID=U6L3D9_EIMTE|nr:hypothetical protein, conserved [Eimeria tenella]CDJ43124.1 hypothetical protein, conserved [Eimeria tenella]|eukprot:XP_013233874.1 hypothetical protein, conserved [Eimeria tenella]
MKFVHYLVFSLFGFPSDAAIQTFGSPEVPEVASAKPSTCNVDTQSSSVSYVEPLIDFQAKTLRDLQAYVALLEEKLEEKLEKHERQQREEQRYIFVFLAVGACLAVVCLVAVAACHVYVHSLQDQLSWMPEQQQRHEHHPRHQKAVAAQSKACDGRAHEEQFFSQDHLRLSSLDFAGSRRKSSCSSCCSNHSHPTAACLDTVEDDLGDEQDVRLFPTKEDVERAMAVEEARAAAKLSTELQQQQLQLEARCSRLFERLHEITDASRAFCSSSSESEAEVATDTATLARKKCTEGEEKASTAAARGTTTDGAGSPTQLPRRQRKKQKLAADPERLEEQQTLLLELQQLFKEIDSTFNGNRPAHVSAMIRCCNALLRADGLAVLKACADCQPLHNAAQTNLQEAGEGLVEEEYTAHALAADDATTGT